MHMIYPNKKEYLEKAKKYNLIPVYEEFIADTDTPVSIFMKAGGLEKEGFLLESIEGAKNMARYSFIGIGCDKKIIFDQGNFSLITQAIEEASAKTESPLDEVQKVMSQYRPCKDTKLEHFIGGAIGYLSYDIVRYFDEIDTGGRKADFPEIMLFITDTLIVFDHMTGRVKVIATIKIGEGLDGEEAYMLSMKKIEQIKQKIYGSKREMHPGFTNHSFDLDRKDFTEDATLRSNFKKEKFIQAVEKAKKHIMDGDIFQVVLSQKFTGVYDKDPFHIYRALRTLNPSPYMFFINFNRLKIIGASPEPLLKIKGKKVFTYPIAGTRKRGANKNEDRRLARELLNDEKEKAEHNMLVDLARNDLGRVCRYGSVKVAKYMYVEKYSHVMHLVSRVEGILDKSKTIYDAFKSTFPAGTLTGAPKIRAMQIISSLEPEKRGPYGGVIGYFGYNGDLDTCITIRTAMIDGNTVYIQSGAGIIYDSIAEKEWEETINKASALFQAISFTRGEEF